MLALPGGSRDRHPACVLPADHEQTGQQLAAPGERQAADTQ
jgi:hypothetical protein